MRVWLEIDIQSSAVSFFGSRFKSLNLGVLHARVCICSGTNHVPIRVGDYGSDVGVGKC